jgi:hypothetical protein
MSWIERIYDMAMGVCLQFYLFDCLSPTRPNAVQDCGVVFVTHLLRPAADASDAQQLVTCFWKNSELWNHTPRRRGSMAADSQNINRFLYS